jgi:hypothetical protein
MKLLDYIRKNYKTPNVAVLRALGANEELIEYLCKTPWNTNMKVVESLIGEDSGESKQGLKSISISPAIQTTPALDSVFPIYWEDLTEEEKAEGKKTVLLNVGSLTQGDTYTATITATDTWYAQGNGDWSEQGGSAEYTGTVSEMGGANAVKFTFGASADPEDDNADYFELTIGITVAGQ